MEASELIEEVKRLRTGIRNHRDSSGHKLCWWVPELWGLLPESKVIAPVVPPRAAFLANCAAYRDSIGDPRMSGGSKVDPTVLLRLSARSHVHSSSCPDGCDIPEDHDLRVLLHSYLELSGGA
jgi:hypothetical protein